MKIYNTEHYWNEVAEHISNRSDNKLIAGDDEPYYRYKRNLFLKLIDKIDYKDKVIFEVGCGPGGNLKYLYNKGCKNLFGVDISSKMIALAKEQLKNTNVSVQKNDGINIPFSEISFNIIFTSTVLQHNTDEEILKKLIKNMCQLSKYEVIIFERIERTIKGHESNLGRPIAYYSDLFSKNNYKLYEVNYLPIQISYYVCGSIRKIFNPKSRKEGEPLTSFSVLLQNVSLVVTRLLDKIVPCKRDVAMLRFIKLDI